MSLYLWHFFPKGTTTMCLRFRFLLKHNISYAYVYVAVVYTVYTTESEEKQGEMLITWINSITENLDKLHHWELKSRSSIYTFLAFIEPEIYKNLLLVPTYPDPDESRCKIKQFSFKVLLIVILPYEWFIFHVYQRKLCRYLLSGEALYLNKCRVAGKI